LSIKKFIKQESLIPLLNPVIGGWGNYFKSSVAKEFSIKRIPKFSIYCGNRLSEDIKTRTKGG
jgi:hypothetical protein